MDKLAKMPGKEVIVPTEEVVKTFRRAAEPIMNEYVNKLESSGLPAKEVYEEMVGLVEKYTH